MEFDKLYRGYVIREKDSAGYFIGPTSEIYRVKFRQDAVHFTKQEAIEYIRNGIFCKNGEFIIEDAK